MALHKTIAAIDRRLFAGTAKKIASAVTARAGLAKTRAATDHSIAVHYRKNAGCDLARLCDLHGSDKGTVGGNHPYPWPAHSYADFYDMIFGHCRSKIRRVLECGIGTSNPAIPATMGVNGRPGASLRVWRDYFPNAEIIGIDIDRNVMFSEERIRTFAVDQTSPASIAVFWREVGPGDFDIIIDDGLHEFRAGRCLFENSVAHLSHDGVYLIEDVAPNDMAKYAAYFDGGRFLCRFVNLYRPGLPLDNNSLLMITTA